MFHFIIRHNAELAIVSHTPRRRDAFVAVFPETDGVGTTEIPARLKSIIDNGGLTVEVAMERVSGDSEVLLETVVTPNRLVGLPPLDEVLVQCNTATW